MRPMSHLTGVQLLHNHGSMLLYQPCWTLYLAVQHWLLKLKILLSTKHSSASLASDHIKLQVKKTQLSTEHFIASLASGHSKLQVNNQAPQGFRLQEVADWCLSLYWLYLLLLCGPLLLAVLGLHSISARGYGNRLLGDRINGNLFPVILVIWSSLILFSPLYGLYFEYPFPFKRGKR